MRQSAGATVTAIEHAPGALALVRGGIPAAIVIDVVLRGKDGRWLAQELRALAPGVKLLAVTGWVSCEVSSEFDAWRSPWPHALCSALAALLEPSR